MSLKSSGPEFRRDQAAALALDAADDLAPYRSRFHVPRDAAGDSLAYFCGNSLGLQPRSVADHVRAELEDWARLAVDAHFQGRTPWYAYHEVFRETGARLVGARTGEVVMMNGLSVNLHLMLVSFYRPTKARYKILIEGGAFPSDLYAVRSQVALQGYDPDEAVLMVQPQDGEPTLRTEAIEELLRRQGHEIAVIMLGGVNYHTGQLFDMQSIVRAGQQHGCLVGYDLAHAAGNVELSLHDWGVDFAVWCSYKYLNAGPGAVAGCFVHERHAHDTERPRLAGWWGNDPDRRFRMDEERSFVAQPGAAGWQLSNPPIMAMAPLRASLDLFDEVGMGRLRKKAVRLTRYLEQWIDEAGRGRVSILTPRDPEARGCQLSVRVQRDARELLGALKRSGIVVDFRPPDVLRVAPVPLYNSFHDVWRFGQALDAWSGETVS